MSEGVRTRAVRAEIHTKTASRFQGGIKRESLKRERSNSAPYANGRFLSVLKNHNRKGVHCPKWVEDCGLNSTYEMKQALKMTKEVSGESFPLSISNYLLNYVKIK